jgi:hypothetical protein
VKSFWIMTFALEVGSVVGVMKVMGRRERMDKRVIWGEERACKRTEEPTAPVAPVRMRCILGGDWELSVGGWGGGWGFEKMDDEEK